MQSHAFRSKSSAYLRCFGYLWMKYVTERQVLPCFRLFWGIFIPSTRGNHGNHLQRRATNSKSLRVSAKQLIVQSRCLPSNKLASELLNTCCIKGGCISNLSSHSFFTTQHAATTVAACAKAAKWLNDYQQKQSWFRSLQAASIWANHNQTFRQAWKQ